MNFRRFFALFLMFGLAVSLGEPVLGELRDGEVHHESATAAALHSLQAQGDHGHEDAGAPTHQHGNDHEHGTGADHCTHQHGTALPAQVAFALPASTILQAPTHPRVHAAWTPALLFHPPKA